MPRTVIRFLLLATASSAFAQPSDTGPGEGFEVRRYDVALRPDMATTAMSATETIVVRTTSDDLKRLSFSPNALRISEATLNGRSIDVTSSKDAIVFALPTAMDKGQTATLRFRMAGTPSRGVTATAGSLYTSYFACDWMVCLQDRTGDKADFALDLFVPAGMDSLGIGRALPARKLRNDLTLQRWRSTRPYSPYLYAFAAGPFARHSVTTAQGELVYLDGTAEKVDLAGCSRRRPR